MKTELQTLLAPFGQEHLLAFWDALDAESRRAFADQLKNVDYATVRSMYEHRNDPAKAATLADRAQDPPAYKFSTVPPGGPPCSAPIPICSTEAYAAGEQALKEGKVGVVLVAGGQGTRLGFDHPKGMFPIGPVSGATLFRIHLEKILATSRRYGKPVPLCLMTSPATHGETVRFFSENGNFGLPAEDLYVFCQGTMPAVDEKTGKLLLADRGALALSPDGHGGMLAALSKRCTVYRNRSGCSPDRPCTFRENGLPNSRLREISTASGVDSEQSILERLRDRGIESLFYFQVDNPLVRVCSPEYIGYQRLSGAEMTCQTIRKRFPGDRVGNVVEADGRLHIIEYSDLPEEAARRTRADGSLAVWAGSIAVHMFDVAFLDRMSREKTALPAHIARKKVSHVDPVTGERVSPESPNAIKFEQFIFDLLPSAANAVVVEVDIPNHYAPLKNASGSASDSPESVRADLVALHTSWLQAAGCTILEGMPVEISPLFALDRAETVEKVAPQTIDRPTYWQ